MKYCIRFIAILPSLSVELTAAILFVLALDYKWLILPSIANCIGAFILYTKYEETIEDLTNLIRIFCNKNIGIKITNFDVIK